MEWWHYLIILLLGSGVFQFVRWFDGWQSTPEPPKPNLDYETDFLAQQLLTNIAKKKLRLDQHSDWDKAFGPPYYYENKEAEFLQLEEDSRPWLTDIQIRSIKRKHDDTTYYE